MGVYRIEVVVHATAYVKAASEVDAVKKLRRLDQTGFELTNRDMQLTDNLWVSGRRYNDPALPVISLSPAMTFRVPSDAEAEDANE
jgi:hypothetical protein